MDEATGEAEPQTPPHASAEELLDDAIREALDFLTGWSRKMTDQERIEAATATLNGALQAAMRVEGAKPDSSAVELGRKGGLKGGKARAEKLSAKRRSEIAKKAAEARWSKS